MTGNLTNIIQQALERAPQWCGKVSMLSLIHI